MIDYTTNSLSLQAVFIPKGLSPKISNPLETKGTVPSFYSILLIKSRHKKLVNEDKTISHFNPIRGNKKAPDKLLVTRARLLMLHRSAKEVASNPEIVFLAIKSITIKKINIPMRLYSTS